MIQVILCTDMQLQQSQVEKYCSLHRLENTSYTEPSNLVQRVLLVSSKHKAGLCPVPKAACTTQTILIIHAVLESIPDNYVTGAPDYGVLLREATKLSLAKCPKAEKKGVLKEYFMFFMFRDPLERLLSGYRSKFNNRPLQGLINRGDGYYSKKKWILSHYHPEEHKKWLANNGSYSVNTSFRDFVDFFTTTSQLSGDPHFMSVLSLCDPCRVRFAYYGNFKTFDKDIGVFMDKINASSSELKSQYSSPSNKHLMEHYGQLNVTQKTRVLKTLSADLEFYYLSLIHI